MMDAKAWLEKINSLYRQYKKHCERAAASRWEAWPQSRECVYGRGREPFFNSWTVGGRLHVAFETLDSLEPADLEKTITIRGQPHSVIQAIQRNLNHVVYHTGQIVQLTRHFTGEKWQTLSIAPGKSREHNAAMRAKYGDWWADEQN